MSVGDRPLRLAVVGHTNTGKTSLIRTLLRSGDFGEIADRRGTTRHVTAVPLTLGERTLIELYDSPGLENGAELFERLEAVDGERHDGPARIDALLAGLPALSFDHEASVLALIREVDVALYVVDAREPVLEKYLDELAVLACCAVPIVVVLNFTASAESREREWRDALARITLHTVLSFDAVVRDPATEARLYGKLGSLLDHFAPLLDEWLAHRREEEGLRRRTALAAIAEMLLDVAACRREVPVDDTAAGHAGIDRDVRRRERNCAETLLDLYRFGYDDYRDTGLILSPTPWRLDPFDPETLRHYGIRTGGWMGAGAGTGAAIDLGTAGVSLGTGTLAGVVIGTGIGVARDAGDRVVGRFRGRTRLMVDDATLRLLAWRQLDLLAALISRGHASRVPVEAAAEARWRRGHLPRVLRRARHHPAWSSLNAAFRDSGRRGAAIDGLQRELDGDIGDAVPGRHIGPTRVC